MMKDDVSGTIISVQFFNVCLGVSIGETSPRLFLGTPTRPDECIKNGFDFCIGIFGILLDY